MNLGFRASGYPINLKPYTLNQVRELTVPVARGFSGLLARTMKMQEPPRLFIRFFYDSVDLKSWVSGFGYPNNPKPHLHGSRQNLGNPKPSPQP